MADHDTYLDELESQSIFIIREAYWKYREKLACLWSIGKDSTTMVHLLRKAFLGKIPVQVIHIDTGLKFKQIYEFRDKYAADWGLNLVVCRNESAIHKDLLHTDSRFGCCNALKTEALKQLIGKNKYDAVFVGIRRDEHAIRAKERYFSQRDKDFKWNYAEQRLELWGQYYGEDRSDDEHVRIHPMLHWREVDIWRYIRRERLPVVRLYFAVKNSRYRSIGCECCCMSVRSSADSLNKIIRELETTRIAERSGRAQDKEKEYMMQKLRSLGYM